jgi:hypothetical protein
LIVDEFVKSRIHHVFGVSYLVFSIKYCVSYLIVRSQNTKHFRKKVAFFPFYETIIISAGGGSFLFAIFIDQGPDPPANEFGIVDTLTIINFYSGIKIRQALFQDLLGFFFLVAA